MNTLRVFFLSEIVLHASGRLGDWQGNHAPDRFLTQGRFAAQGCQANYVKSMPFVSGAVPERLGPSQKVVWEEPKLVEGGWRATKLFGFRNGLSFPLTRCGHRWTMRSSSYAEVPKGFPLLFRAPHTTVIRIFDAPLNEVSACPARIQW